MQIIAATPGASSVSPGQSSAPEEGFDKALDRATADAAPPGAQPPEKGTDTQAGEVAETEQKTPPQTPDSQPEDGSNTSTQTQAPVNVANAAMLLALANLAGVTPSETPVDTPSPTVDTSQTVAVTTTANVAALAAKALAKSADTQASASDEAGSTASTESPETESTAKATNGGYKLSTHSVLGKIEVKVTAIQEEESTFTDSSSGDADDSSDSSGSGDPKPSNSTAVVQPQAVKTAHASETSGVTATDSSQSLSTEKRDLVYKQVSDRLELLAATRPKEAVTIHLQPEDLGNVTVVLKSEGAKVSASLYATHEGVREALKEDSSRLAQQLQTKGVASAQVEVSASSQPQQTGSNTQYRDQQSALAQQAFSDGQNSQRQQQQSQSQKFSRQQTSEISAVTPKTGGRGLTAVDLSI